MKCALWNKFSPNLFKVYVSTEYITTYVDPWSGLFQKRLQFKKTILLKQDQVKKQLLMQFHQSLTTAWRWRQQDMGRLEKMAKLKVDEWPQLHTATSSVAELLGGVAPALRQISFHALALHFASTIPMSQITNFFYLGVINDRSLNFSHYRWSRTVLITIATILIKCCGWACWRLWILSRCYQCAKKTYRRQHVLISLIFESFQNIVPPCGEPAVRGSMLCYALFLLFTSPRIWGMYCILSGLWEKANCSSSLQLQ